MRTGDFNLYTHFYSQFVEHADDELLCTERDRSYRYSDIDKRSAQFARYLTDLGASPGDRISVQVEKSPESLCLYLACLRAGLVYHPLNMGYKSGEIEYFLGNAEPVIVICDARNEDTIRPITDAAGIDHLLTLNADGGGTLSDNADPLPAEFATLHRDADDLAALLYSSGTTGVPKGIMLTHSNLLRNTEALVEAWGFTEADRL